MVIIIETNLSLNNFDEIMDLQSRVIEVESWELYVKEIINHESVNRKCIIGSLFGNSLPRNTTILNIKHTDRTLSCDVVNFAGIKTKKIAYRA